MSERTGKNICQLLYLRRGLFSAIRKAQQKVNSAKKRREQRRRNSNEMIHKYWKHILIILSPVKDCAIVMTRGESREGGELRREKGKPSACGTIS